MEHWQNIDVELFDHDTLGDVESVRVRVSRSPAGVQAEAVRMEVPPHLRLAADKLSAGSLGFEETIELGRCLCALLFPDQARSLFERSRGMLQAEGGLRIRIEARALPLADLPWEFLYLDAANTDVSAPERGFLGLDRTLSVVRYEPVATPTGFGPPLMDAPLEVTMLLANPDVPGWQSLNLQREIQAVESALADEAEIQLRVVENTSGRKLNDALDARPHVFHFAGHGQFKMQPSAEFGVYIGQGELLLENESGGAEVIAASELATKMRGCGVRLAVLNNCESARRDTLNAFTGVAPTLVRDGVPAVVAMQYNIRDKHAVKFTQRLYHNLAQHQSIDSAVTAARIAMFNLDGKYTRDWGVPVLYLRSDKSVLFPDKDAANPELPRLGRYGWLNTALATTLMAGLAVFYIWHLEPRLPVGNVLWGVIAVVISAGLGFLKFVAGGSVRLLVLRWLRRKVATGILVTALIALVGGLLASPLPILVRVVPGKTLIGLLAKVGQENPLSVYDLKIVADGKTFLIEDFRKSGAAIAGTWELINTLSLRYQESTTEDLGAYINQQSLGDHREIYLSFWQNRPSRQVVSRLGKYEELRMILLRNQASQQTEDIVSCQTASLKSRVTLIIMEKQDAC